MESKISEVMWTVGELEAKNCIKESRNCVTSGGWLLNGGYPSSIRWALSLLLGDITVGLV